jgi:hypothetical protein
MLGVQLEDGLPKTLQIIGVFPLGREASSLTKPSIERYPMYAFLTCFLLKIAKEKANGLRDLRTTLPVVWIACSIGIEYPA